MAPQEFVMISKTFSDGVFLKKEGPLLKKEYSSELVLEGGKSCIAAAKFDTKWKPKHYVTTLTVGEELSYFESVLLGRQTEIGNYSETISVFPKDKVRNYRSLVFYDPNATHKRFVAGIELLPARKCVVAESGEMYVTGTGDATGNKEKSTINGDISRCSLTSGVVVN